MIFYYIDNDKAVVADSEKAFVKLMKTKYEKYPYGMYGLYTAGLETD